MRDNSGVCLWNEAGAHGRYHKDGNDRNEPRPDETWVWCSSLHQADAWIQNHGPPKIQFICAVTTWSLVRFDVLMPRMVEKRNRET